MRVLITLIVFSASSFAFAETNRSGVEDSIQKMVKDNIISESEAKKINRNAYNLAVHNSATRIASRGPASVSPQENTIQETKGQDLDLEQFRAIQFEMKRFMQR